MQNGTKAWWLASLVGLSGCLPSGEETGSASADEELGALSEELSESAVRTRVVGSNTAGGTHGDFFGSSLAFSDDGLRMVVGAPQEDSRSATEPDDNSMEDSGAAYVFVREARDAQWVQEAYLKASNPDRLDQFGWDVAISGDGKYVAVGAHGESSGGTTQSDNSLSGAGATYVYRYDVGGGGWVQDAYVKASRPQKEMFFGASVSLSTDGRTLAVSAVGAGGDLGPLEAPPESGAAYVFRRGPSGWTEQAVVTASNADEGDRFGEQVELDGSGNLLAVSAPREASNATGVDGNAEENLGIAAGAAYVFKFEPTQDGSDFVWKQQSYIKRSYPDGSDFGGERFSESLALSSDGSTLAVGTSWESSAAQGINGDQSSTAAQGSGAVWVFRATANGSWAQEAYVKSNNSEEADSFGESIALSNSGDHLVVGAPYEDSNATKPVNGDPFNDKTLSAGAAYVFERSGTEWAQQAYLKPPRSKRAAAGLPITFGNCVAVNGTGDVIGAGTDWLSRGAPGVFTFTDP
jgi:trimeric autotransporter adhesin